MTNRICTVGHSTRGFDEVMQMLRAHDVTCLVDVRSFPSSRKYPQWNRSAIEEFLPSDIGYRWIRRLGGRRHTPKGVPSENGAWRVKAFRDYADYMAGEEFAAGLGELLQLAGHERPAIMCSEAVPWRCHRRLITDALIVAGAEVVHIMSPTTSKPAVLNELAQVRDGHLVYPPPR
ncbi:DNA repair protein [Streptomyces pharetrae CZA14]|uniref:DNA repair protein n=1 Tax=Streptomyces pharetrae CZA14 TaxID=1144883 RepID=A0ABX3YNR4_9ACTN|nr:DNA repair protein [Streptomyces pharetrae CZA14]